MVIRTFEVYLIEEKPYGYEIETPYPASLRGFEFSYDFAGKSAHLVIVSNDGGLDRAVALRFASAIAHGTFKKVIIDRTDVGWYMQERRLNPKK